MFTEYLKNIKIKMFVHAGMKNNNLAINFPSKSGDKPEKLIREFNLA
jgi:hypothetical protein